MVQILEHGGGEGGAQRAARSHPAAQPAGRLPGPAGQPPAAAGGGGGGQSDGVPPAGADQL